jgi:hypothetical protein
LALSHVLGIVAEHDQNCDTWIVGLTDGCSDDINYIGFRNQLVASPRNVFVTTIGINLDARYESELQQISRKYCTEHQSENKGFFIRADSTTESSNHAFDVVKSMIPVSQTFERDGVLTDCECRHYIAQFLPTFVRPFDMLSTSFWVEFLYRRVKVFDENESFNYNEVHHNLGGSLMEVMLDEAVKLLQENYKRDWVGTSHNQLIYDFTKPDSPAFRLICSAPDKMDEEVRRKLSSLDLPSCYIPTKQELDDRTALDRALSQALDVPIQTRLDGSQCLRCIDDSNFILTLDFALKLLNIHERVACRVPCPLEGET